MKTESLIETLSQDARPVKPLLRPSLRLALWSLFAALWMAAAIAVIGRRNDLGSIYQSPGFLLQAILLAALALLSAYSAFSLSVPGRKKSWLLIVPAIVLLFWLFWIASEVFSADALEAGTGLNCLRNILLLSLPPGFLLCFMLKKAMPLKAGTAGMLAALGTAALANMGTRFLCHHENPLHLFIWHFLPVFAFTCAGAIVGRFHFER
jgi:hypothetical protein